MPQVHGADIKARAARLRALGEARIERHLAKQAGQMHRVLMESARMGRTEQFAETVFEDDRAVGDIITAQVTGTRGHQLLAA